MEKMKSLADQLREKIAKPDMPVTDLGEGLQKKAGKKTDKVSGPKILEALINYDNSENKSMVHVRFNKHTVDIMNKFKMATNVDVTKFVAFAVKEFFDTYPELKTIIKQFIQNTDL